MCRKLYCLSGCLYFVFLCCTEWKMCSFIRESAVLMPSGNLNSGRGRDTDDLKVRPLKVNRWYSAHVFCWTWVLKLYVHDLSQIVHLIQEAEKTRISTALGECDLVLCVYTPAFIWIASFIASLWCESQVHVYYKKLVDVLLRESECSLALILQ
jgi:hypothetical protein